jgi:hypothetical protein
MTFNLYDIGGEFLHKMTLEELISHYHLSGSEGL